MNNLNDLLVEMVLFSDFSIKYVQIAHALFSKQVIYAVWKYRKQCFYL